MPKFSVNTNNRTCIGRRYKLSANKLADAEIKKQSQIKAEYKSTKSNSFKKTKSSTRPGVLKEKYLRQITHNLKSNIRRNDTFYNKSGKGAVGSLPLDVITEHKTHQKRLSEINSRISNYKTKNSSFQRRKSKASNINFKMTHSGIYVNEKLYFDQAFKENKLLFDKIKKIEKREKPKQVDTSNFPINTSKSKNTSYSTSRIASSKLSTNKKYSSWLTNSSLALTNNSRLRSGISGRNLHGEGVQSHKAIHSNNSNSQERQEFTKRHTFRYLQGKKRRINSSHRTKRLTTSETKTRRESANRFSKNSNYNSSYKIKTLSHEEDSPKFSQQDVHSGKFGNLYLQRGGDYHIGVQPSRKLRENMNSSLSKLFV
ncbi:unnamed protein product [Moneuplotes crassus]|uniref:Uncharacterized protein n=1 Tax=Euplotes crassus TaxID=5936 RepID=A0AAD1X8U0_EUPCR|nr:unnamed protein product [Moneuplotes crassus]